MILSRGWSVFLIAAGVFNWVIWPRFAVAIWDDPRAWNGGGWKSTVGHSSPTSFLVVHAVLIFTALAAGTTVGVLGVRGMLATRRQPTREESLADSSV